MSETKGMTVAYKAMSIARAMEEKKKCFCLCAISKERDDLFLINNVPGHKLALAAAQAKVGAAKALETRIDNSYPDSLGLENESWSFGGVLLREQGEGSIVCGIGFYIRGVEGKEVVELIRSKIQK